MVRVVLSISAMVIQFQYPAEFFNLLGREMAVAARRQVQSEKADLHAPQLLHQQAEVLEHFADLFWRPSAIFTSYQGLAPGLIRFSSAGEVLRPCRGMPSRNSLSCSSLRWPLVFTR